MHQLSLSLNELQRIKQLARGRTGRTTRMEYHLWDGMLTLWVLGWVGWLPAMVMDALWALPLCVAGICTAAALRAPGASGRTRRTLLRLGGRLSHRSAGHPAAGPIYIDTPA